MSNLWEFTKFVGFLVLFFTALPLMLLVSLVQMILTGQVVHSKWPFKK